MSKPISVLIVEDEVIIANKIQLHLEQLGYTVAGIVARGDKAIIHCRAQPPDIILLDIQLKGTLDGVETALVLEREGLFIPIIYLTANADAASFERARRTHPHAFLSKPYKKADLDRAICLAAQLHLDNSHRVTRPSPSQSPRQLLSDCIFVRHKQQLVKVLLDDILFVEAQRAYCHIVTADTDYLLSVSLGKLGDQLNATNFMRVHRSYLVNLVQVEVVTDKHVVIGTRAIPVSKDHREELKRRVHLIR